MTDDNHEFTDSSPGEQAYESAVSSTKSFVAKYLDTAEAPAHCRVMGEIGSGITHPKNAAESDDAANGGSQ